MHQGSLGMGGALDLRRIPAQTPHRVRSLRVPRGRLMFTRDRGDSRMLGEHYFMSNLRLIHRGPDGVIKDIRDTGSGLVTNAGVNLMSFDWTWAAGATLKQMNSHALGTGVTTAAGSDVWLQTIASNTNFAGVTNGYMTGTQSTIANATLTPFSPIYQTSATFTCNGGAGIAITEWILTMSNAANSTGTATSTSSTTLANTGATFTTAGNGLQGWTVEALASGTIPVNTPTTTAMLQVSSNTGTVLTGLDNIWASGTKSWLSIANQAVATPSGTTLYVAFPTAWDHKVFGAVTLNNGDTLQTTYQLSLNSGG